MRICPVPALLLSSGRDAPARAIEIKAPLLISGACEHQTSSPENPLALRRLAARLVTLGNNRAPAPSMCRRNGAS